MAILWIKQLIANYNCYRRIYDCIKTSDILKEDTTVMPKTAIKIVGSIIAGNVRQTVAELVNDHRGHMTLINF